MATNNNKLLIFIISILLVTNIAMLVFFVWMKKPEDREHRRSENSVSLLLKDKVGFSDAQMKQYEALRQQHRESMKPLFDSIRLAKEFYYSHLDKPSVNDSVMNVALAHIGDKQEQIDQKVFTHFRKIREICTAAQQPKFDTLIQGVIQKMIVPWRKNSSSKEKTDSAQH